MAAEQTSDPYHSHSFDELCELPIAYRDGLFESQVFLITGGAGAIGTAMATLFGRLGASIVACGMRRLGDVWDIARGAAYLAGPTGDFVTGTHLEITGGEHVWGEYWPLGKPDYFRLEGS